MEAARRANRAASIRYVQGVAPYLRRWRGAIRAPAKTAIQLPKYLFCQIHWRQTGRPAAHHISIPTIYAIENATDGGWLDTALPAHDFNSDVVRCRGTWADADHLGLTRAWA